MKPNRHVPQSNHYNQPKPNDCMGKRTRPFVRGELMETCGKDISGFGINVSRINDLSSSVRAVKSE
jgi:hypothetical protein